PQPKARAHGSCSATESRGSPVAEAELHPERGRVTADHWPDEDAELTSAAGGEVDAAAEITEEEARGALVARLQQRPLADDLRERLEAFLRAAGDEPLEEALAELGDNAMQVAFGLLFGGG
ncbi:MAG: hypothetical protein KTR31_37975, partial [Myxococcales bacterium]|nr:hypothetical protein [Myxococcales bacterium]